MKRLSRQIRATLFMGIVGPPIASLILLMAMCLPPWRVLTGPIDAPSFVVAYVLFAIPVGYAFGVIPALLAGTIYSWALTVMSLPQRATLLRASIAALSGGLVGGLWFHAVIGPEWPIFGSAAAVAAALRSRSWPTMQKEAVPHSAHHNETNAVGARLDP
jgi:hypothetical protein